MSKIAASPRKPPYTVTSFSLPRDLVAELREASRRTDISQTALVRRGLRHVLTELEKEQAA